MCVWSFLLSDLFCCAKEYHGQSCFLWHSSLFYLWPRACLSQGLSLLHFALCCTLTFCSPTFGDAFVNVVQSLSGTQDFLSIKDLPDFQRWALLTFSPTLFELPGGSSLYSPISRWGSVRLRQVHSCFRAQSFISFISSCEWNLNLVKDLAIRGDLRAFHWSMTTVPTLRCSRLTTLLAEKCIQNQYHSMPFRNQTSTCLIWIHQAAVTTCSSEALNRIKHSGILCFLPIQLIWTAAPALSLSLVLFMNLLFKLEYVACVLPVLS